MSDSVESKHYIPDEFTAFKISKQCFSVFHLNIASLSGHIDDLKAHLALLDHPFNTIGITETKIFDDCEPISNIKLDNYQFENIPTSSHFGGAAFFIRKNQLYQLRSDLTRSDHLVAESIFIELTLDNNNKMLMGCFYRPHTPIKGFDDQFFNSILSKFHRNVIKIVLLWEISI